VDKIEFEVYQQLARQFVHENEHAAKLIANHVTSTHGQPDQFTEVEEEYEEQLVDAEGNIQVITKKRMVRK